VAAVTTTNIFVHWPITEQPRMYETIDRQEHKRNI
jgi:hypothetical protein